MAITFSCPKCGCKQPYRWPPDLFAGDQQTPIWRCPSCGAPYGYYLGVYGATATAKEIADAITKELNRV